MTRPAWFQDDDGFWWFLIGTPFTIPSYVVYKKKPYTVSPAWDWWFGFGR